MHPSLAFETTTDDVLVVMTASGKSLDWAQAETVFAAHVAPHAGCGGRIETAALHGNDLDQQTEYAHQEIAIILREQGVLP